MNYSFELLSKNPELITMPGGELHPDCITACELESRDYVGARDCCYATEYEAIRKKRFDLNVRSLITKYQKHHA